MIEQIRVGVSVLDGIQATCLYQGITKFPPVWIHYVLQSQLFFHEIGCIQKGRKSHEFSQNIG
ncbi:hypothetical protein Bca4012_019350 [Brassica carinata]